LLAGAAFVPPFNFFLFGLENFLFLLFPMRIMATNPGDFQALGRNVLFMIAKFLGLGIVVAFAGGAALLAYFVTGGSMFFTLFAAWLVLLICAAITVPLVAMAFTMFDVGRDIPA
jgi:hypothetical protein